MTWLLILAGVILLFLLLGMLRLGAQVEYSAQGLFAKLRVGALRFQLYPGKRKKKEPKENQDEQPPAEAAPKAAGGKLEPVRRYLPLIGEAAGELKRKICIDCLKIDLTVSGSDPSAAAMAFGFSNAALGMIWPVFEQNFQVKEHRLRTGVDFDAQAPVIYVFAAASLRLGQLVSFAIRFGWKFLKIYLAARKSDKTQKEAI